MMLPVSRFKGHQPVGMVTAPPWPPMPPPGLWLAGCSTGQLPLYYPPTWIQWEVPSVELVPLFPPVYQSSLLPHHPPLSKTWRSAEHKLVEGWFCPEEVAVFQLRDKPLLLTNQIVQSPRRHAPRNLRLLSTKPVLPGLLRRPDRLRVREVESDAPPTSCHAPQVSCHAPPTSCHAPQVSCHAPPTSSHTPQVSCHAPPTSCHAPLRLLGAPPVGRAFRLLEFPLSLPRRDKGAWPLKGAWSTKEVLPVKEVRPYKELIFPAHLHNEAWLRHFIGQDRWPLPLLRVYPSQAYADGGPVLPLQMFAGLPLSPFFPRKVSRSTFTPQKRRMKGGGVCGGALVVKATERRMENECAGVCIDTVDEEEDDDDDEGEEQTDRRPVASSPVPGSPWCVVWTGDDRVFFFNPTMHLSVWERPCDLIGQDLSSIIKDPPHKRKRPPSSGSTPGPDYDHNEENGCNSKRNRLEESVSLVPGGAGDRPLPLELRVAHFREMMLERGVSAFSSWEKELHKMVFDSRYLLLSPEQRKQVFEQFVKSRMEEEHKEKKMKLLQFKALLEEAKITSRTTFKEFCVRYRGDHRFHAFNRKKEQEVLFNSYITSCKRKDKENRARLRKMR